METQAINTLNIDPIKLRAVTDASNTSIVAMLRLALRQRDRQFINVTSMKEELVRMGEKIVDEEFSNFWSGLEKIGVGNYIVGRRGNPDRFMGHYSMKTVAQMAIEGKEQAIRDLDKKLDKKKEVKAKVKAPTTDKTRSLDFNESRIQKPAKRRRGRKVLHTEKVLIEVPLKGGLVGEIIVPKNLSKEDRQRLCDALKA